MKKHLLITKLLLLALLQTVTAQFTTTGITGNLVCDGKINVQRTAGNTLYVGGKFSEIFTKTGPMANLDIAGNALAQQQPPLFEATGLTSITTVVSDGSTGFYVAGDFTTAAGNVVNGKVVRLNADLSVNSSFNPQFASNLEKVVKLILLNSQLYVVRANLVQRVDVSTNTITTLVGSANIFGYINDAVVHTLNNTDYLYLGGTALLTSANNTNTATPLIRVNLSGTPSVDAAWTIDITGGQSSVIPEIRRMAVFNNILYFGGKNIFNVIGQSRQNFGGINLSTNNISPINIRFNGNVNALVHNGIDRIYIGGEFTQVTVGQGTSQGRTALVAVNVNASSGVGALIATFNPSPVANLLTTTEGYISALNVIGGKLYVGGWFNKISSNDRTAVAVYDNAVPAANNTSAPALNTFNVSIGNKITGTTWNPLTEAMPLGFTNNNGNVLLYGAFNLCGGIKRGSIAAIDLTNGAVLPFNPSVINSISSTVSEPGEIRDIFVNSTNTTVYLGGKFNQVNQNFCGNFAVVNNQGILASAGIDFYSDVNGLIVVSSDLYAYGSFQGGTIGTAGFTNARLARFTIGTSSFSINNSFTTPGASLLGSQANTAFTKAVIVNGNIYIKGNFDNPGRGMFAVNASTGALVNGFNFGKLLNSNTEDLTTQSVDLDGEIMINGNTLLVSSYVKLVPTDISLGTWSSNGRLIVVTRLADGVVLNDIKPLDNGISCIDLDESDVTGSSTHKFGIASVNNAQSFYASRVNVTTGRISLFYDKLLQQSAKITMHPSMAAKWVLTSGDLANPMSSLATLADISAPAGAPVNLTFSGQSSSEITLNFTPGSGGTGRIVLARKGSAVSALPTDFDDYNDGNGVYGNGAFINGSYLVYNGSGNTCTVKGLDPNSNYHFRVVEYNGRGALTRYFTTNFLSGNTNTLPTTPTVASDIISVENVTPFIVNYRIKKGNGDGFLMVIKTNSLVQFIPSNNTNYSTGQQLPNNEMVLYRIRYDDLPTQYKVSADTWLIPSNVFGNGLMNYELIPGTTYHLSIFEFGGNVPLISYKTDVFDRHNFTTLALASEPTVSASNLSFRNIGSNSTVVKWTNGNGAKRLVLALAGNMAGRCNVSIDAVLFNNGNSFKIDGQQNLTANANFLPLANPSVSLNGISSATNECSGWASIVYNGALDSVVVTNLLPNTDYSFYVVEYNEGSGNLFPNYFSCSACLLGGVNKTDPFISAPTQNATNIQTFASINSLKITWDVPVGRTNMPRLVVLKANSPVNFVPLDNTAYTAATNFTTAPTVGAGNKIVLNSQINEVTVTGLNPYATYHIAVYEYNSGFNNLTNSTDYSYNVTPARSSAKTAPSPFPQSAGGNGEDAASAIARDGSGNIYVAGTFKDKAAFGAIVKNSVGGNDAFVAKYSSIGELLWVNTFGSSSDDAATGITVSGTSVFVCGSFKGTMGSLTAAGDQDIFLVKLNQTDGAITDEKRVGGTNQDAAYALTKDFTGAIIITGFVDNSVDVSIGGTTNILAATSNVGRQIITIKYNASLGFDWARLGGSSFNDYGNAVIAEPSTNNIYVVGEIRSNATFGSFTTTGYFSSSTANNAPDIVVVKYSSTGVVQFVKRIGSGLDDAAYGVAVDGSTLLVTGNFGGNVFFNGTTTLNAIGNTDGFVAKLNSSTGDVNAAVKIGGIGPDRVSSIDLITETPVSYAIAGTFSNNVTFGTENKTAVGNSDIFTAKLNASDLSVANSLVFGSAEADDVRGLVAINSNQFFIAGYYKDDISMGGYELKRRGLIPNEDIFVHATNIVNPNADPSADLLLWYKFNGNTNDAGSYSINATATSGVVNTTDRTNQADRAYSIPANNNINTGIIDNKDFEIIDDFTAMAWVKLASNRPAGFAPASVIRDDEISPEFRFEINANGSVSASAVGAAATSNDNEIFPETWYHIAFTFQNGGNIKLFIDGIKKAESSIVNKNLNLKDKSYSIGGILINGKIEEELAGSIDDVRWYKRALTAAQIADIMQAPSVNSAPPQLQEKPKNKLGENIEYTLWPNPTNGIVNIGFNNNAQAVISYNVMDISGKIVYSSNNENMQAGYVTKKIDLSALQSGYYILQVAANGSITSHKFIITK